MMGWRSRLAIAALVLVLTTAALAQEDVKITPEGRASIDAALAYLARTQNSDGSWNTANYAKATACTSLAALAFMSDGNLPGRGKYGDNVARALDYVLKSAQPSGLLEYGLPHHAMYSHGYSTLFLAEAWGTTGRADIRDKLKNAVDLIISTQNREGGWRYEPKVADADLSVTITQIVALRAAANAGIAVPRETVDNGIGYLKKCLRPDGGFSYQAGTGPSGFARTGAGLLSFILAGQRDAPQVPKAAAWLQAHRGDVEKYFYYGEYYAAQGVHLYGGSQWPAWYSFIGDELVRRQRQDGSWPTQNEDGVQATAMATLVLTIPNGYLPIYQK
jgi:prenyltransferase beta subunit